MRDDFLSREWADNRTAMNAGLGSFFQEVGAGLARLNAMQFDAPWKHEKAIRDEAC